MTKYILEPQYSIRLCYSTSTMLFIILYGLYCKLYLLSLIYFSGLLSSLNHWRSPQYDMKRLIDLSVIRCGGLYYYYLSWFIPSIYYFVLYHFWIIICLS